MLNPFNSKEYHKNTKSRPCTGHPCAECGMPVKEPWKFVVEVFGGGSEYGRHGMPLATLRCDPGYMGNYPVGPTCAKKLRKDGVIVTEVTEAMFSEPTVNNEVV